MIFIFLAKRASIFVSLSLIVVSKELDLEILNCAMDHHKQATGSCSNGSVEVESKGVGTKNDIGVHVKKFETVIQLDESALSSSTTSAPDTDSSKMAAAEYYRLTSASRSKFLGKSPSVYESVCVYK